MKQQHMSHEGFAHIAKHLGISTKQLLARWEHDAAEQMRAEKHLKRLKAMAKRRGCELYRLWDNEAGPDHDGFDESGDEIIVYLTRFVFTIDCLRRAPKRTRH
jgi:hypothetical protein